MSNDAESPQTPASIPKSIDWKRLSQYLETFLVVIVISFLQFIANSMMEERARYTLMLIGTCYGTWRGGKGPGVFALLLSGLIGAYVLTHQHFTMVIQDIVGSFSLTLYLLVGAVIIVFGESQRKERKRAQDNEAKLIVALSDLAKANETLEHLLEVRQEELSEIKRFVAEEELPNSLSAKRIGDAYFHQIEEEAHLHVPPVEGTQDSKP